MKQLVASALFEAWCLVEHSGAPVAVVWADEVLRPPFAQANTQEPLALSVVLDPRPDDALAALDTLRRDETLPPQPDHAHFGHLHIGAALPLVEAVATRACGTIALELAAERHGPVWCVDVAPGTGAN